MAPLALLSRNGGRPDPEAIADSLELNTVDATDGEVITGRALEEILPDAREAIVADGHERVVIIASTGVDAGRGRREDIENQLAGAGASDTVWIDPRLCREAPPADRARLLAATASAALRLGTSRSNATEPSTDHVVVVDDTGLASDVATQFPVTLITETRAGRRRQGIETIRGRPRELLATGSALAVTVDRGESTDRLTADQVVWPGYDGELADRRAVHNSRTGVVSAVRRVARDRARDPVVIDDSRCVAGRKGSAGCRACADVCPHDALSVSVEVTVDAEGCIDCGLCLGVCPTAALASPRASGLEQLAEATRSALDIATSGGSRLPHVGSAPDPVVVAFTARSVLPAVVEATIEGPQAVPIPVVDAGRIPPALVAATLAAGAGGVAVVGDPREPAEPAVEAAHHLLDELTGETPVRAIATADPSAVAETLQSVSREERLVANPDPSALEGRASMELTANALEILADGRHTGLSAPALGSVSVDEGACTLCQSCERLCPTGALSQPDAAMLRFDPAACVGCGVCAACPEDAITVEDRIDLPLGERHPIVESAGVVCERCGEPFASEAGLATVREALDETELPEEMSLECCPSCRQSTRAEVSDP